MAFAGFYSRFINNLITVSSIPGCYTLPLVFASVLRFVHPLWDGFISLYISHSHQPLAMILGSYVSFTTGDGDL